jgi:hypothetical protein
MAHGPRFRYASVISTVDRAGKVAAFAFTTPRQNMSVHYDQLGAALGSLTSWVICVFFLFVEVKGPVRIFGK